METSQDQRDSHEEDSTIVPSISSVSDTEKEQLLGVRSYIEEGARRKSRLKDAIILLSLLNMVLIIVVVILFVLHGRESVSHTCTPLPEQHNHHVHSPHPSWLPPEIHVKKTLYFNRMYGRPPDEENREAWDAMMPRGRGFVIVKNETVLPEMPSLHQDLPEQHAMVSAFHQMHCVWASKDSFFKALNGTSTNDDILHMSHCWDYLRQTIMCNPDTTLEWMPNPTQHLSKGWGYQHKCLDWDALYNWAVEHRWANGSGIH